MHGYCYVTITQEIFLKAQCQFVLFGVSCIYTLCPLEIGVGVYPTMVLEHINPRSNGGPNMVHNVVFAENGFNRIKGSIPLGEFAPALSTKLGYAYNYHDAKNRIGQVDELYNDLLPEHRTRYDTDLIAIQKNLIPTITRKDVKVSNRYPGNNFFDDLWISDELREKYNGQD